MKDIIITILINFIDLIEHAINLIKSFSIKDSLISIFYSNIEYIKNYFTLNNLNIFINNLTLPNILNFIN